MFFLLDFIVHIVKRLALNTRFNMYYREILISSLIVSIILLEIMLRYVEQLRDYFHQLILLFLVRII